MGVYVRAQRDNSSRFTSQFNSHSPEVRDITAGHCADGRCLHNINLITQKGVLGKGNPLHHEVLPLGQCLKQFLPFHCETLQLCQLL